MVPEEKKMGKKSVAICKDEKELFDITLVGFSPCISCFSFFPLFFYPSFFGYYFSFSCLNPFLFDAAFRIFFLRVFVSLLFPLFFYYYFFFSPIFFPPTPFPLYLLFFSLLPRGWRSSNIYLLIFLLSDFSPFFFVLLLVVFPFFFFFPQFFFFPGEIERAKEQQRRTEK